MKNFGKRLSTYKQKNVADYSSVGLMFPASIGVGLALGYFLDKLFHTAPYLLIIFTLYGIAAGFWNLFKVAKIMGTPKKNDTENHDDKNHSIDK